jgi:2-keto-3-deoxy-L-rhamnonate aldolase RhmA
MPASIYSQILPGGSAMKKNILRELINTGKPTLSTRMLTTSPQSVEMIGHSGALDFIELAGEYASWTMPDFENFARAVELFPYMSSMIKVEKEPRLHVTQRAIGAGIQNVLFADCNTAEEVEECIQLVRPGTPQDGGSHGISMRRNVAYGLESTSPEWLKAMRDVVIEVMIESDIAVNNLDEILSVRGLDMIRFGPADYSLSIGKIGQERSPEVQKVHRHVIETALKKRVRPQVVIGSYEEAREYIDMGVRDFCIGNDLGILYRWCRTNGKMMREMLGRN